MWTFYFCPNIFAQLRRFSFGEPLLSNFYLRRTATKIFACSASLAVGRRSNIPPQAKEGAPGGYQISTGSVRRIRRPGGNTRLICKKLHY
jgi:hypothetical protein